MFDWYPQFEFLFAATQLAFAMFGIGLVTNIREFKAITLFPKSFLFGVLYILLGSPLIALAFINLFEFSVGGALGILIVSVLPGGSASNLFVYLGKGHLPLSIILTTTTTLASLIAIPLVLTTFLEGSLEKNFQLPLGSISFEILSTLIFPLVVGMFFGPRLGKRREVISKAFIRFAFFLLAILVISSLGSGHVNLGAHSWTEMIKIIGYGFALMIPCNLLLILFKTPQDQHTSVSIECTMRNMNLGILVSASLSKASPSLHTISSDTLFIIMFYGGYALITGFMVALVDGHIIPKVLSSRQPL